MLARTHGAAPAVTILATWDRAAPVRGECVRSLSRYDLPLVQLAWCAGPASMHALLLLPTHLIIKLRFGFTMSGCLPFVLAPSPGMPIGVASCAALGVLTWRRHAAAAKARGRPSAARARAVTLRRRLTLPCARRSEFRLGGGMLLQPSRVASAGVGETSPRCCMALSASYQCPHPAD